MTPLERRGAPGRSGEAEPEPGPDGGPEAGRDPVRTLTGRDGLTRVQVRTPSATAEVCLQGAHVTRWAPTGSRPVLWTGAGTTVAPGRPISGGVRVCVPPAGRPDPGPLHGPGCARPWRFAGWARQSDDVVLSFVLASAGPPAEAPFRLRYTVTVGGTLTTELRVTNTGGTSLTLEPGLPTLLAVADVREVLLLGLGGLDRIDRHTGRRARTPAAAPLHLVAATDHLYTGAGAVTVVDWEGQRSVRLRARGASNTVVWTPWSAGSDVAAGPGAGEWTTMVGLTPGNHADGAVVLAPGAEHALAVSLDVGPLP